jgi:hypothetical protein
MDSVERLKQKKKSPPGRNRLSIGRLPKKPDADHQKNWPPKHNVNNQDCPLSPWLHEPQLKDSNKHFERCGTARPDPVEVTHPHCGFYSFTLRTRHFFRRLEFLSSFTSRKPGILRLRTHGLNGSRQMTKRIFTTALFLPCPHSAVSF